MCGAIHTQKLISQEEFEQFIENFDENKNCMIDYEEFKKMMISFQDYFCKYEEEDNEIIENAPLA